MSLSRGSSRNGHYQVWIMNGVTIIPDEIRHWLDTAAGGSFIVGGKWIGACAAGSVSGDREGMMYNFSCPKIARRFLLVWG